MSAGDGAVRKGKPAASDLLLLVLVSAVFVTVLMATMINVVIPLIGAEFGASTAQVGWMIVSPNLFGNRTYVAALVVGFFSELVNVAALVFVPLLVVEVNGLSPGAAGLVLTPGAVALAVLSPLSGRLSDRIGVRIPIVAGLALMGLSALFISAYGAGASPSLVSAGMLGIGAGFAFAYPPTTNAAAGALPDGDGGAGLGRLVPIALIVAGIVALRLFSAA
jgi:MFS family permease